MEYFYIHSTTVNGVTSRSIEQFNNRDAAEQRFHSEVAYDMNNSEIDKSISIVINETGQCEFAKLINRK